MIKKIFLFAIILILASFSRTIAVNASLTDTVVAQTLRTSSKTFLQKQSLEHMANNPDTSYNIAVEFLRLPESEASNQEKTMFFKMLGRKFEEAHNYKQALECYKIADSLSSVKISKKNQPAVPVGDSSSLESFYLFAGLLIILLIFFGYSMAGFLKFNSRRKELQDKQNLLNKELNKLQSGLDARVRSKNLSLYEEFESMKEEEISLKSALKKAEEAAFLRNAFIANLGFDVRTPLNGIIGFANMLETELAVEENMELYEYASNIAKSGLRLLKLLNNVIDLSSIESNTLKFDILPVSPENVVRNIFEQYAVPAKEKNLIFKSKIDSEIRPVLSDEKNLEKILMQIVDNAIKYTDSGFVTLSAVYDQSKDIDIIEIKDTGPGIDEKRQKLLFELNDIDTDLLKSGEGTGIGLKLAKKLVDLMNAGIEIDSKPGVGTTFRLLFPCSKKAVIQKSEPQKKAVEVTTASELGNLDIFVVEDDRMNRIILDKMLKNIGSVKLAVDGKDCMEIIDSEAAKKHFYQIMLFDINLPGDKDGVALMKEIRNKYPEYRKIPFIAQTAYAMAEDEEYFLKEGFDSYLSKPINRDELISTIKQQFSIFGGAKK
ncbi:MAG: response regulator [Bacteroidales bacterium]|nr:response regulator [Bacteroidales bacterium]